MMPPRTPAAMVSCQKVEPSALRDVAVLLRLPRMLMLKIIMRMARVMKPEFMERRGQLLLR